MKPYLLFVCDMWEPCGGIDDYQGDFATLEEAITAGSEVVAETENGPLRWHVVTYADMKSVASSEELL